LRATNRWLVKPGRLRMITTLTVRQWSITVALQPSNAHTDHHGYIYIQTNKNSLYTCNMFSYDQLKIRCSKSSHATGYISNSNNKFRCLFNKSMFQTLLQIKLGLPEASIGEPSGITETAFFTNQMPILSPNQQCQSTEGTDSLITISWWWSHWYKSIHWKLDLLRRVMNYRTVVWVIAQIEKLSKYAI